MYSNRESSIKLRLKKKYFVWLFALVALAAIAIAEDEQSLPAQPDEQGEVAVADAGAEPAAPEAAPAQEQAAAEEPAPNVETEMPAPDDATIGLPVQTIIFKKDTTIKDALRFLAAKYQKNIVPSTKVDGNLAFTSLYNVTFDEAMDAILGASFKYEQQGQLTKVYTKEEYAQIKEDKSRMEHKVFTLYYISAVEAIKLIQPVLSGAAIVQGSSAAGVGVSTGDTAIGEAGGNSMALNDMLVVHDYPENLVKAEQVIKSVDVRPLQVLVEATIMAVKLTEDMEFGVDWNALNGFELDGFQAIADSTGAPIEQTGFANLTNGLRVGAKCGDVFAFINALEEITDTSVLANPKILALNKQMGTVFIGEKLGYRTSTTLTSEGVATEGEVEFLDSGTKLSFRPYIADDGYIRMDIYPKDSSAELNAEGVPTETTAELTTNILVKDGETVVIGGLFRDVITTTRNQVPILGDIPIVGIAFRGTDDNAERQEVIVLLTPHIIRNTDELNSIARTDDVQRKREGAVSELNGISRAGLAEEYYRSAVKAYLDGDKDFALLEVDKALHVRESYLEALRLKEKIISETEGSAGITRILLDTMEQQQAPNWRRY